MWSDRVHPSLFWVVALLSGCAGGLPGDARGDGADTGPSGTSGTEDADGDGFTEADGDCNDRQEDFFPGAADPYGDGSDQNCDGVDGVDGDGDGVASSAGGGPDCDDAVATTYPGASDAWYDGVDANCDGASDFDADADGYDADVDCDDTSASAYPGAPDLWYDGVDSDCDGASDYDADGDGFDVDVDCDDASASSYPGASEVWYDGVDADCDAASDYDADGDGFDVDVDCDDTSASANPGASEVWYDGVDANCDGASDFDADADGYDVESDCDEAAASIYPGAYDRPSDAIDQDCDGEDRTFEGIVLDAGGSTTTTESLGSGDLPIDLAVLMDTTASMGSFMSSLDFTVIDAGMSTWSGDVAYGYATYDDYASGSFGKLGTDLPFILSQQITDDVALVDAAESVTPMHSGQDSPEAGMEALYQLLTGAGYDLTCDSEYDVLEDVPPFIASASDPFAGTKVGPYDPSVSGTGSGGGIGFREGATPVVVYITDAYLRDPDSGSSMYGSSPGGCPLDAGRDEVVTAANALGAFLVGIGAGSTPGSQMRDLATRTSSYVDEDGDGAADDSTVYTSSAASLNETIISAVELVDAQLVASLEYDEVWVEASVDDYGLVSSILPSSYTAVTAADWPLDFSIDWTGALSASSEPQAVTVSFVLYGDGEVIETFDVAVEVPPL